MAQDETSVDPSQIPKTGHQSEGSDLFTEKWPFLRLYEIRPKIDVVTQDTGPMKSNLPASNGQDLAIHDNAMLITV